MRKILHFCKKNDFILICMLIALINLVFAIRVSGRQSLAFDEICMIGFVSKKLSLGGILNFYLTREVTNLPLFALFAALWYRIVPYGEMYLLLFTEICTYAGIVILALAGKEYRGKTAGYFTCVLATISSTIMLRCSLEFRAYAFLFLFGAITLFYYLKRYRNFGNETKSDIVKIGISMTFLAYSHYFGCLLIVGLFCGDFVLFLLKKIKWQNILSYIMAGGLLLPWFLAMLINKEKSISEFWPKAPNLASIPEIIRFALSNDEILFVFFIVAIGLVLAKIIIGLQNKIYDFKKNAAEAVLLIAVFFVVGSSFIYSAYINYLGGVWVEKYFVSIIPPMLLVIGFTLDELINLMVAEKTARVKLSLALSVFLIMYVGIGNLYYDVKDYMATWLDPYREVRDYCVNEGDAYDASTLIIVTNVEYMADAYNEYYFGYAGKGKEARVVSEYDENLFEELSSTNRVYLFEVRHEMDKELKEKFEKDFGLSDRVEEYGLSVYKRKNS